MFYFGSKLFCFEGKAKGLQLPVDQTERCLTPGGGNRKRSQQSTDADQKSIETVFSIPICRHTGDKWESKTLFLLIFDLRSWIVFVFSIAAYPVCV